MTDLDKHISHYQQCIEATRVNEARDALQMKLYNAQPHPEVIGYFIGRDGEILKDGRHWESERRRFLRAITETRKRYGLRQPVASERA